MGRDELLGVFILLASAPSNASLALLDARSAKPLNEFSACFALAAERGNRVWAYMPGERGGTFTDSGARGSSASYWLHVRGERSATHLRLFAASPAVPGVVAAIEQCR